MKTTHSIASILLITALVVSGYSCKPVAPASLPSLNISTNQTVTAVPQNPTANQTVSNSTGTSTITVRVSPLEGGKVSPSSGNYSNGTDVTFTATPAASFVFSCPIIQIAYFWESGPHGSVMVMIRSSRPSTLCPRVLT